MVEFSATAYLEITSPRGIVPQECPGLLRALSGIGGRLRPVWGGRASGRRKTGGPRERRGLGPASVLACLDARARRHDLVGGADVDTHQFGGRAAGPNQLEVVCTSSTRREIHGTAVRQHVLAQLVSAPIGLRARAEIEFLDGFARVVHEREASVALGVGGGGKASGEDAGEKKATDKHGESLL